MSRDTPYMDPAILRTVFVRLTRTRRHRTVTTPRRKSPAKRVATVSEPRTEPTAPGTTCDWCGSPMSPRRGKRFCSNPCKSAHWDSLHPRLTLRPKETE